MQRKVGHSSIGWQGGQGLTRLCFAKRLASATQPKDRRFAKQKGSHKLQPYTIAIVESLNKENSIFLKEINIK
jgi:hypothetical protein